MPTVYYSLQTAIGPNPATGLVLGQPCSAYFANRFAVPPTTNTAPPGAADYSSSSYGVTSGVMNYQFGGAEFTVTQFQQFYVEFHDPADTSNGGTFNRYWTPAVVPIRPTPKIPTWFGSAVDRPQVTSLIAPSIAAGSNGVTLPNGTIYLSDTSAFNSPGSIMMVCNNHYAVVSYTGKVVGALTGCTLMMTTDLSGRAYSGGPVTMTTGDRVMGANQATASRRIVIQNMVFHQLSLSGYPSGQICYAVTFATYQDYISMGQQYAGVANYSAPTGQRQTLYGQLIFPVDPYGWYGVWGICDAGVAGSGNDIAPYNTINLDLDA